MRPLALISILGVAVASARSARAQAYVPAPTGPAIQDVPQYPPDQGYGPQPEDAPDPNAYAPPDVDVAPDEAAAQSYDDGYDPQAYGQFEGALAAYGQWVDDPTYGRVWVPYSSIVGDDFAPYDTNGQWCNTEYGWTWSSDWDWGWAPFHYGRWAVMGNSGWGWVPGTIWGPAWVSWRVGGGYVGWAALPPRGTVIGSPVAARSPWRFTAAGALGVSRAQYVSASAVPGLFGRMQVVSNQRFLAGARGSATINAGPSRVGSARPVKMAMGAPSALPRLAIQSHVGVPIASRPWAGTAVARPAPARGVSAGFGGQRPGVSGWQQYRVAPAAASRPLMMAPAQRAFAPGGPGGLRGPRSDLAPNRGSPRWNGVAPAGPATGPRGAVAGMVAHAPPSTFQGRSFAPAPIFGGRPSHVAGFGGHARFDSHTTFGDGNSTHSSFGHSSFEGHATTFGGLAGHSSFGGGGFGGRSVVHHN